MRMTTSEFMRRPLSNTTLNRDPYRLRGLGRRERLRRVEQCRYKLSILGRGGALDKHRAQQVRRHAGQRGEHLRRGLQDVDLGAAAVDREERHGALDQELRQSQHQRELADMGEAAAARRIGHPGGAVRRAFLVLVAGRVAPADDAVGIDIGIVASCAEHREQSRQQLLGRGVEIDASALGAVLDGDIGAAEAEREAVPRRPDLGGQRELIDCQLEPGRDHGLRLEALVMSDEGDAVLMT